MKRFIVQAGGALSGYGRVPGDKSISHRAIMLGALAEGQTEISGFLEGEDNLATLNAFRQMGVQIEGPESGKVLIQGAGLQGLVAPGQSLDLGNSGTSMRLMAGLGSRQGLPPKTGQIVQAFFPLFLRSLISISPRVLRVPRARTVLFLHRIQFSLKENIQIPMSLML